MLWEEEENLPMKIIPFSYGLLFNLCFVSCGPSVWNFKFDNFVERIVVESAMLHHEYISARNITMKSINKSRHQTTTTENMCSSERLSSNLKKNSGYYDIIWTPVQSHWRITTFYICCSFRFPSEITGTKLCFARIDNNLVMVKCSNNQLDIVCSFVRVFTSLCFLWTFEKCAKLRVTMKQKKTHTRE